MSESCYTCGGWLYCPQQTLSNCTNWHPHGSYIVLQDCPNIFECIPTLLLITWNEQEL